MSEFNRMFLRRFPWRKVSWTDCPRSFVNHKLETEFHKDDIDDYVDNLIRKVSRQTFLSYEDVLDCIKEENPAFFKAKERLLEKKWHFYPNDPALLALQQLLMIPDVGSPACRAEHVLELFKTLPDSDKLKVITHLLGYKVTITKKEKKNG